MAGVVVDLEMDLQGKNVSLVPQGQRAASHLRRAISRSLARTFGVGVEKGLSERVRNRVRCAMSHLHQAKSVQLEHDREKTRDARK